MHDVVIIGGGPAGLSAALLLARACRDVAIVDAGKPRNYAAARLHGFLSRDGVPPLEFLACCRRQLRRYENVTFLAEEVTGCTSSGHSYFQIRTKGGAFIESRLVLLAVGVKDDLPPLEGLSQFYPHSVHHCPYCNGWEHRGGRLVTYGADADAIDLAIELTAWSPLVTLCTGTARSAISRTSRARLDASNVSIIDGPILRLEGEGRCIKQVLIEGRAPVPCDALFFVTHQIPSTQIMRDLGCELDGDACVGTNEKMETCTPGVYAAGNGSPGLNLAIIAAAEGAKAAYMINDRLTALASTQQHALV